MANRTVSVFLRAQVADYQQKMGQAKKATGQLGDEVGKLGKNSKADFERLSTGLLVVGGSLAALGGAAVLAAAKFDKQMSEVGAVADASAQQMDQLRKAAIDAGAATVFSAQEAAQAEAELAKAGVKTADILGGALDGALALAAAGQIDLAQAAEIAAAAMNTFGLAGKDVTHIADVLAAGANKSAAGVDDLGQGLQQVGLVAKQAGLSLEETVGVLSAMADRGLKGSDGATSLKTALQRLTAPTVQAKGAMKDLGLSFYDANGQMVRISDMAGQLKVALDKLSPAQRNAALQTIFGSDAIRAANVLYGLGKQGVDDYVKAVNDQGAAADNASKKLNNLSGDFEQLKGSIDTLLISSGEGAMGPLRMLSQQATSIVNLFAGMPAGIQGTTVALLGFVGVTVLAGGGFLKLRTKVREYSDELSKLGPRQAAVGKGLQSFTAFAGKAGLAVAGIEALNLGLHSAFGGDMNIKVNDLRDSLMAFGESGKLSGELARQFGGDYKRLGIVFGDVTGSSAHFEKALESLLPATQDTAWSLTHNTERIQALDAALLDMAKNGHAKEAGEAFVRLAEEASKAGVSADQFRALFPQYLDNLPKVTVVASHLADATAKAAAANYGLAEAFGEVTDAADSTASSFSFLYDAELNWRGAARDAEQSTDDLKKALKESGGSLDITTEKGRRASAMVDQMAQSAATAAQKKYEETNSVDDAVAVYEKYIGKLRGALKAAGLTKKEIDDLITSIAKTPTEKTIVIKAKLYVDVIDQKRIRAKLNSLTLRHGGVVKHAAGGSLRDADVFAAGSSPLYAFAEPETGGEAFVPRKGDYGRSMGILGEAAAWYGADVVPRGHRGGGAMSVNVTLSGGDAATQALVDKMRVEVRTQYGGNVQSYLAPRRGR